MSGFSERGMDFILRKPKLKIDVPWGMIWKMCLKKARLQKVNFTLHGSHNGNPDMHMDMTWSQLLGFVGQKLRHGNIVVTPLPKNK